MRYVSFLAVSHRFSLSLRQQQTSQPAERQGPAQVSRQASRTIASRLQYVVVINAICRRVREPTSFVALLRYRLQAVSRAGGNDRPASLSSIASRLGPRPPRSEQSHATPSIHHPVNPKRVALSTDNSENLPACKRPRIDSSSRPTCRALLTEPVIIPLEYQADENDPDQPYFYSHHGPVPAPATTTGVELSASSVTVQDPVTGEVGMFPVCINWPKQLTTVHVPAKQPNCFRAQTLLDPRRSISASDLRHVLQAVTQRPSRPERPASHHRTGPTFTDSPPVDEITRRFEELGDELNYTPHFDLSVPYDYRSLASPPKLIVPKPTSPPAAPIDLFA